MKKLLLFTAGLYMSQFIVAQTPIAYYAFNGNANDASGNNLHGSIVGSLSFTTDRFGNTGKAIAFNGNIANRVVVADNALLHQANVSITAWVKLNNASGNIQTFVDKPLSPCTADSWHFGTENSNYSAWLFRTTGCNDKVQTTSPVVINKWAFVAMTADATNQQLKLYINGSLVSTQVYAGTISYDNNPMYIGVGLENNSLAFPMDGALDEVKVYGTILTASQIEKEYSPIIPMPVASYNLNGNANDNSGNNLHGTIIGSPVFVTDRLGNANRAISFNGNTANRVEVADNALLRPESITISAWVKMNSNSGIQTFIDKPLSPCYNDSWHYGTEGSNSSTWVSRSTGCGDFSQVTSALSLNTWVHMVATTDAVSRQLKLYLNGVLVNTSGYSGSIPYDNNAMYFGAALENNSLAFPLNGALDDVMIFNTALTATQVLGLFNGEACNGVDDDADGLIDETCIPTVSIDAKNIDEGNSDTTELKLTMTLNHAFDSTVTVKYKTSNKTATAGSDYVAVNDKVKFKPGQTSKKITIKILGDVIPESNEDFYIILSNPVNATLSKDTAIVKIKNDDASFAARTNEMKDELSIRLSPNPAKDMLTVSGIKTVKGVIEITNLQGYVLLRQSISSNTANINISRLQQGMYMLRYVQQNEVKTLQFIKE